MLEDILIKFEAMPFLNMEEAQLFFRIQELTLDATQPRLKVKNKLFCLLYGYASSVMSVMIAEHKSQEPFACIILRT